ncbi:receptor-type tyrosine-protein phosphatase C, partial [Caerostris extrusa]
GAEEREIVQLHYTNWPSHTCPFPSALLEFRRRVQVYMMRYPSTGPVVVHCSDGCGRTGTYLCIEANLESAEEDFAYDVFGYAKKLRGSRRGMIETLVREMLILFY